MILWVHCVAFTSYSSVFSLSPSRYSRQATAAVDQWVFRVMPMVSPLPDFTHAVPSSWNYPPPNPSLWKLSPPNSAYKRLNTKAHFPRTGLPCSFCKSVISHDFLSAFMTLAYVSSVVLASYIMVLQRPEVF